MSVTSPQYGASTVASLSLALASVVANTNAIGLVPVASSFTSFTINNSGVAPPYDDIQIEASIQAAASGLAATPYVGVFAQCSEGGANFDNLEDAILLGTIPYLSTGGVEQLTFEIPAAMGMRKIPAYIKITFVNWTGATLAGGTVKYQGFNESIA